MVKKIKLLKSILISNFTGMPYKINFCITNRCNGRCLTCNTWKENRESTRRFKDELTLDEIDRFFCRLPKTISWISLTGGEPFLRDDIEEIVKLATNRIKGLSLINIPTNGLVNSTFSKIKNILNIKKRPWLYINFSIDGTPEIHNKIRGNDNAFFKTWEMYQKVKKLESVNKSFKVGIETTISSYNIGYIVPFLEQYISHRDNIMINIAHNSALYKNTQSKDRLTLCLDPEKTKDVLKQIKKKWGWFSIDNIIKRYYVNRVPFFLKNPQTMVVPCKALKSSIAINSYGDLSSCLMWDKTIGNLREYNYDISTILASQQTKELRSLIVKGNCPNCWTPCEAIQSILGKFWY